MATAAAIEPTVKNVSAIKIKAFRPKILENDANAGWNTVEQRRKDVPAQNASTADPRSLEAIIGRATDIEVASSAATSVN